MVLKIVLYALMVACVGGLLWANKQYKGSGAIWARPLSILLGLVALSLAVAAGFLQVSNTVDQGEIDTYRQREAAYQRVAYKKLGEMIAEKHAGTKALLLRPKDMGGANDVVTAAQMEGLKTGLGGNVELVTEQIMTEMEMTMVEGDDPNSMVASEDLYSAKMADDLVKANRDCKVLLTTIGLPPDYKQMELWKIKDKSKRPVIYMVEGDLWELQPLIKHGLIGGCIAAKPVPFDIRQELPGDEQAMFDKRFLMITPESVDSIAGQYQLFKPIKKK